VSDGRESLFAPAREDGLKPWVRESYHFGQTTESIVWAADSAEARHMYSRMHLERIKVRRAKNADVERLS